ncbi:MAG TPA: hypothetical protein VN456_12875 [Desulfosporosinus sp.]|nr:hypothetical protein [Desulfosporosinus sp.]
MASSFKRSFIGYDPVSVGNELSAIDQEFAQKREKLHRELEIQVQQKESLLTEVERLRQELAPSLALQNDISSQLLTIHLKGTEKVSTAIKDMEQKESDLMDKIKERKKELLRLENLTGKMSNEFLATANRYGTMLSSGKEGEAAVKD